MPISGNEVRISVRVHPRATKNEVAGVADGIWQVRVSAPPVKGKANKELVVFLSQKLRVAKDKVNIIVGHTARNKVVAIRDLSQEEVTRRLSHG